MKHQKNFKQTNFLDPLLVDSFAGGGGTSTGLELFFGRPVDIAINHDPAAIKLHEANHPYTKHYCESVFDVDLRMACQGRHVALFWLSPDCTHFSKARGGTPVKKEIRGLAWIAVRAAHDIRPDVIMLENVEEILTWGKLCAKRDPKTKRCYKAITERKMVCGTWKDVVTQVIAAPGEIVAAKDQVMEPDPKDRGRLWKKFIKTLQKLGYECEWKILKACDYGAPTSRKRLFGVFRCDGKPIVWPAPTHGNPESESVKSGRLKPWRTAAECIDFTKEAPSIFTRKKPLAVATQKRIVRGIDKFVIKSTRPFIIQTNHISSKLAPIIGSNNYNNAGRSPEAPLPTTTTQSNHHCLCTPVLTHYHSATSENESRGMMPNAPLPTIDTSNRHAIAMGYLSKAFGGNYKGAGSELKEPLHTITAQDHNNLVVAHISKYYNGDNHHADMGYPLPTITAKDRMSLVESHLTILRNNEDGKSLTAPVPTITAGGGHIAECRTVLVKFEDNGDFGHWSKIRELLNVYGGYQLADDEIILFQISDDYYFLSDIGLRMLDPEELKLAQGFPHDYILDHDKYGKPYPKTQQVAKIGNSVCPQMPYALASANLAYLAAGVELQTMTQLNQRIAISA